MPQTSPAKKGRILSGMRPTGKLHLGNYVGALRNWVGLQDDYDCFFFIADWHALTTDYADTRDVKQNSLEVILDYLAAGLDPERSTLFIQSHVPQHAELHLLFSMITPLGWLERVPSYKEQRENIKDKDLGTYGFLGYPLLQSADILLYTPSPDLPESERKLFVPVGEDQVPHVELTREVARRFNQFYPLGRHEIDWTEPLTSDSPYSFPTKELPHPKHGKMFLFSEPQPLLTPAAKLPGTDGRKMSKSYNNFISLTEPAESVYRKLSMMVNDPQRERRTDPGNPDVCPVGDLHKLFSSPEVLRTIDSGCRTAGIGCIECKEFAAQSIVRVLQPIQNRRAEYEAQPAKVVEILETGAEKARTAAEKTMEEVRGAMRISRTFNVTSPLMDLSTLGPTTLIVDSKYWNEGSAVRGDYLREQWLTTLPRNIALKEFEHRMYRTPAGKRVAVTTGREREPGDQWKLSPPRKKVDVLVLLCWEKDTYRVIDFVLPQRVLQPIWAVFSSIDQEDRRVFRVIRKDDGFFLSIPGGSPKNINDLMKNYEPLER